MSRKYIPPFLFITWLGLLGGIIASDFSKSIDACCIIVVCMFVLGGFIIGKNGAERDLV